MIAFDQEQPDNVIAMPQKSNEWYTPSRYIEAAREVMNGIDLDPASSIEANQIVKARRYFTEYDNGLVQDWTCTSMWLNPPYTSARAGSGIGRLRGGVHTHTSIVRRFILKLLEDFKEGKIDQAILLVTTDTDASWFIPLWEYPICFADHKIRFKRPGLPSLGQFFGSSFIYLGANEQKFIEVFSQFGRIAKAIDTPKAHPINLSLWEAL